MSQRPFLGLESQNPPRRILDIEHTGQRENGRAVNLTPDGVVTSISGDIIQLSSENAGNPETLTITLYRSFVGSFSAFENTYNGLLRANVRWGAGKVVQSLVCDYHHGTRFTLDASSLEISATYMSSDGAAIVGPTVRCSAAAVYGNIGTRNLTLTDFLALNGGALSQPALIPSFAGRLSIGNTGSVAPFVRWMSSKLTVIGIDAVVGNVSIPNGAEYYRISNGDVVAHAYNLMWGLNV